MTSSSAANSALFSLLFCQCLLLTQSQQGDEGCTPNSPVYPSKSGITSAQAAGESGLLAIIPSYNFSCDGIVTRLSVRASGNFTNAVSILIWRPQGDGTYTLQHSVDISEKSDNTEVFYNGSIPILTGDTIGYRLHILAEGEDMRFILDNDNTSDVLILSRMTAEVPCQVSLCDSNSFDRNSTGMAPFISMEFDMLSGEEMLSGGSVMRCEEVEVMSCMSSHSSSSPSSSLPLPSPTPPSTDAPTTTTEGGEGTEDDGGSDTLLNLNLTTETVIVLIVGVILFLVLIVLVVVLVACVCRKMRPPQYRFKSPTPGSIIGTPITAVPVITASSISDPDRNGTYMNSAMQTSLVNGSHSNGTVPTGSADPLSPSDHQEADHSPRERRMRSPLLPPESPRNVPPAVPPKPHRQAGSHSHQSSTSARETSLPPSPSKSSIPLPSSSISSLSPPSGAFPPTIPPTILPAIIPPPPSITLTTKTTSSGTMSTFTSRSDSLPPLPTSSPPPLSTTLYPSASASMSATTDNSAESIESISANNSFEFVDFPTQSGKKCSRPYDHLVASSEAGTEGSIPSLVVPDRTSKTRHSQYIYTYVPTEEQRRLIKLQLSGHYEVTEEVKEMRGYDHLKFFEERETYWSPATTTSGLYAQLYENKYRELPREQIIIKCEIGSGHFGSVSKGEWLLRGEGGEVIEGEGVQVAVKVVKTEAEEMQRVKLLQEAAIMGQFSHPNVVRLNGVVTVGDPTMIVLEYMPQGDLKSYLQRMRPHVSQRPVPRDAPRLFIRFGKDIAAGMSYLARKNFIHRDLATRNILLSQNLTCKIGDFGMARDIAGSGGGSDYYKSHGGIIPVKWTAPESLNYNRYTSASDVWSYGMVLYEIWSLGYKPFHELTNPIVIALVTSKHCQAPPPGCPRPLYHLMVECWNPKDTQRPPFDCIQTYLDSPEDSLLQWSPGDVIPGKQAHVLGAPLTEGNNLYIELQRTYQNQLLAQLQSSNA